MGRKLIDSLSWMFCSEMILPEKVSKPIFTLAGIDLQRCLENSEIDLAQALKSTKLKKKCVQNKLNVLMRELLVYPLDFD